ncbi:hypothetical protein ABPG75_013411 [Micractinium tetrahymenae]
MPPQPTPAAEVASAGQSLSELEAAVDALRNSALSAQAAVAEQRAAAVREGAQAVLAAAYCRRLQRVASLLQQYDVHLQRTLATVGLGQSEERSQAVAGQVAAHELAAALQGLQEQLAAVALGSSGAEPPTPEVLLELASSSAPPAGLSSAGVPALLAALHDSVLEDLAAVNTWPGVQPPAAATGQAGSLSPAFCWLQQEQRERWEATAQRAAQLEALRGEVAAARAALAAPADNSEAAASARLQLAAQQAGLRAELHALDRARQAAEKQGAAGAQLAAAVREGTAAVAELEQQEAAVDAAVRALCAADSAAMRAWRQGTWQAQEQVEAGVASQRQPLVQLAQQLLEAQRAELAAFKAAGSEAGSKATGKATAAASLAVKEAAQLLDPLANLRSDQHAAAVVAAAAAELRQLQPVLQQWEALAAASSSQLAALQSTAGELEGRVRALQEDGGADAAMAQLREAAAAADEAGALVGRTRQALSEWWTSPAVTAAPWIKREGKSADEWLRLLGDQHRALQQREAFTGKDKANHLLRALR